MKHLCVNLVGTLCHFLGCAPAAWQRDYSKHDSYSAEIASSCHCRFCNGHHRAHCLFWHHLAVLCRAGSLAVGNRGSKLSPTCARDGLLQWRSPARVDNLTTLVADLTAPIHSGQGCNFFFFSVKLIFLSKSFIASDHTPTMPWGQAAFIAVIYTAVQKLVKSSL